MREIGMEKLKSPLTEQEYNKINSFFKKHKKSLKMPNDQRDLREFITNNGLFSEMLDDLAKADTTLAWMHLRRLVIQDHIPKKIEPLNIKKIAGWIVLIIPLVVITMALYSCVTSSSDKPKGKKDYEFMTDCQNMIERSVRYPSSVNHGVMATVVHRAPNGNIAVMAPFSAKNAFGMESQHRARCIFTPDGSSEISMTN